MPPMATPCDSPNDVSVNIFPKVFPAISYKDITLPMGIKIPIVKLLTENYLSLPINV
jgi:hypothetical protein